MAPQPVPTEVKCSECGLPWDGHGDEPTLADCVRLLKAELARRPRLPPSFNVREPVALLSPTWQQTPETGRPVPWPGHTFTCSEAS